jgi:hypothetical protein
MQGAFLSTTSSMVDMQGVSRSQPPAVWTCRVYSCPAPVVWACRVSLHHQQNVLYKFMQVVFQCGRAGFLSTTNSMDVQGVFPPSAVRVSRVSFHHQQNGRAGCLSTTNSMDVQGVFPPSAVRVSRVSFHHQQNGRAGCLSTTNSMDVQGVFPPSAVRVYRVSFHHEQYGRAGCLSTTGSMEVQVAFPPPAAWTIFYMHGVFPPQAGPE